VEGRKRKRGKPLTLFESIFGREVILMSKIYYKEEKKTF
jgi:hypothetical protein